MSDKKPKAKAKWPAQMQMLKNATAAAGQKKTSAAAKRKSNCSQGKIHDMPNLFDGEPATM